MTYMLELFHAGTRVGKLFSESWKEIDACAGFFSDVDRKNHYTISKGGSFVLACYPSTSVFAW